MEGAPGPSGGDDQPVRGKHWAKKEKQRQKRLAKEEKKRLADEEECRRLQSEAEKAVAEKKEEEALANRRALNAAISDEAIDEKYNSFYNKLQKDKRKNKGLKIVEGNVPKVDSDTIEDTEVGKNSSKKSTELQGDTGNQEDPDTEANIAGVQSNWSEDSQVQSNCSKKNAELQGDTGSKEGPVTEANIAGVQSNWFEDSKRTATLKTQLEIAGIEQARVQAIKAGKQPAQTRPMPLFLRRSRFVARRRRGIGVRHHALRLDGRRYGDGQYFGRRHGAGSYRERRHGLPVPRGAGPTNGAAPAVPPFAPPIPDWLLAVPAAPMLGAVDVDPALAPPPPPFWCQAHEWVVCPLHVYGHVMGQAQEDDGAGAPMAPAGMGAAGQSPTSVFDFGGPSNAIEPRPPSPTPVVVETGTSVPLQMPPLETPRLQEREGDTFAFVSAPTGATPFTSDSRVRSFTSAAHGDAVAPPRPPSQTPASPPSPRPSSRRRLMPFGFPSPSLPSSGRGRRAGTWSPAMLGLANDVAPGSSLPGYSSDEEARGGSSSGRR